MRASSFLLALLPSVALADYGSGNASDVTTSQITSTTTRTVVRVMTATMTSSHNSTIVAPTAYAASATSTKASAAKTSSSSPVQVTKNAAARGGIDVAVAAFAGAVMYLAL